MKSLNLANRTHGPLSLVLLGVLALNVSWLYPTPKEWGMTQLSSTQESSSSCPGVNATTMNRNGATLSCELKYGKKLKLKKDEAEVSGRLFVIRSTEMVEKAQAEAPKNEDPFAAQPAPAEKKPVEKEQMVVYKVSVKTAISAEDVDKDREETRTFYAKDFQGKSFSELEREIFEFAKKSHAGNIAKIVDEVKDEEKKEKEEARKEKLEEEREKRAELCLIQSDTDLDEKEVLLTGDEKYACNLERMKNTKNQKDAAAIYNAEIKPHILEKMTSVDSADRKQGQGMLEAVAKTKLGSNGQIRASLGVIQRGSGYMVQMNRLQEQMAMATSPMQQTMIQSQIGQLNQVIQNDIFRGATQLAQMGQADATLGDTYAYFQNKFTAEGSVLFGSSSLVGESRKNLEDLHLDVQYRIARGNGTGLVTTQTEFDTLRGGNLNQTQQLGLPTYDSRTRTGVLGQTPPPPIQSGSRVPVVGTAVN